MTRARQVIIEFYQVGAYIKVSAVDPVTLTEVSIVKVDPVTLTEVSIVGDPTRSEAALKRLAMQRLEYVLARKAKADGTGR